jgi:hypothetical protein
MHGVAEMRAFRELASYVVYTEELGIKHLALSPPD